jgi:hypothetical protein
MPRAKPFSPALIALGFTPESWAERRAAFAATHAREVAEKQAFQRTVDAAVDRILGAMRAARAAP